MWPRFVLSYTFTCVTKYLKPYDTWNGGFSGDITAGSNGIASSPLSISSSSGSTGGGSILPELAQIKVSYSLRCLFIITI